MVRVLVVDDHQRVRDGLQALLATTDDIQVVGTAADGQQALDLATDTDPDVVLMDISMPGMDGIQATRRLLERLPEMRVVMLTSFADEQLLMEAVDAGAVGYLVKDADPLEVIGGVRAAARGDSPVSGKVARALLTRRPVPVEALTKRERQVLSLVAAGLSNQQIAIQLGIVEGTVKAHLTNIFKLLGVTSRTQAAEWARHHGPIDDRG